MRLGRRLSSGIAADPPAPAAPEDAPRAAPTAPTAAPTPSAPGPRREAAERTTAGPVSVER